MNENETTSTNSEGRFYIRDSDHAIIDNEGKIGPIMVDMTPTEDGSESGYTDRSSVKGLLNRLDYKANHNGINLTALDAIVDVERKLIVLEKIMKDIEYVARTNFKETNSYPKQREYQYLMEISKHYERLFNDAYFSINQAKREINNGEE